MKGFFRVVGILLIVLGALLALAAPPAGLVGVALGIFFFARLGKRGVSSGGPVSPQPKADNPQRVVPAAVSLAPVLAGVSSFGSWDASIHAADGQDVRFDRALFQNIVIQAYNAETGVASIAGSRGDIYQTTLDHCTCEDFQRRGLPCKHIYKLALSMGYSADAFFAARPDVVWFADNCRTYHSDPACRGLKNRFSRRSTVAMAEYAGLRPCKTCCDETE